MGALLTEKASSLLEFDQDKTQDAVNKLIPTLLGFFRAQASSIEGADSLFSTLMDSDEIGDLASQLLISDDNTDIELLLSQNQLVLEKLLGDHLPTLHDSFAAVSGFEVKTSSTLLELSGPTVAAGIKRVVEFNSLSMSGFYDLMIEQAIYLSQKKEEELEAEELIPSPDSTGEIPYETADSSQGLGPQGISAAAALADIAASMDTKTKTTKTKSASVFELHTRTAKKELPRDDDLLTDLESDEILTSTLANDDAVKLAEVIFNADEMLIVEETSHNAKDSYKGSLLKRWWTWLLAVLLILLSVWQFSAYA